MNRQINRTSSKMLRVISFIGLLCFSKEARSQGLPSELDHDQLYRAFNKAIVMAKEGTFLGYGIPTYSFFQHNLSKDLPCKSVGGQGAQLCLGAVSLNFFSDFNAQIEMALQPLFSNSSGSGENTSEVDDEEELENPEDVNVGNGQNEDNRNYVGFGFGPRVAAVFNWQSPTYGNFQGFSFSQEIISISLLAANYRRTKLNQVIPEDAKWYQPGWKMGVFFFGYSIPDWSVENEPAVAQEPQPLNINDFQIPAGPPAGYNVPIVPSVNAYFNVGLVFNKGIRQFVKGSVNLSNLKNSGVSAGLGPQLSIGLFASLGVSIGLQGLGYVQAFLDGTLNMLTFYANAAISATVGAVKYPVSLVYGMKMFTGKVDAVFRIVSEIGGAIVPILQARYNLVEWDVDQYDSMPQGATNIGVLSRKGGPVWANCLGSNPHPHCSDFNPQSIVDGAGANWAFGGGPPSAQDAPLPTCNCTGGPYAEGVCRTPAGGLCCVQEQEVPCGTAGATGAPDEGWGQCGGGCYLGMHSCPGGQPAPNNPNSYGFPATGMCAEQMQAKNDLFQFDSKRVGKVVAACSLIPSASATEINTDGWCCPILGSPPPNNSDPCCVPIAGPNGSQVIPDSCVPGSSAYVACHSVPVYWQGLDVATPLVAHAYPDVKKGRLPAKEGDALKLNNSIKIKSLELDTPFDSEKYQKIEDMKKNGEGTR
jgi:hypothetical protein